ncbi:MAG: polysaccharide deacetylase family protein [Candidatus Thiodiazotropha sp.]
MVTPENFAMQLSLLKECFEILDVHALADSINELKNETDPKCIITFDDAWFDNYDYAYSILEEHSCPAIIFAPTDYVASDKTFWQEELGRLIWSAKQTGSQQSLKLLARYQIESDESDLDSQKNKIMNYVRSLKVKPYEEIDAIISDFTNLNPQDAYPIVDRHMTWEQLNKLSDNGIAIGSHACSHRILTKIDKYETKIELSKSKDIIEKKLNKPVKWIAYPNGDYHKEIGRLANEIGYEYGFGTIYGHLDENTDLYNINRLNVNDAVASNRPMFMATLLGIF